MRYSRYLPRRFKARQASIGAGWIINDTLFYSWSSQIPFLIGFKISKNVSFTLYLGLWYISFSKSN